MKTNEWHWARLKKDLRIKDRELLAWLKSDSFTIPENTLVWVREGSFISSVHITLGPEIISKIGIVYQFIGYVKYSDLLEPLE